MGFSSNATWQSSIEMSTRSPSPVAARLSSADWMPMVAYSPAPISPIDTPTRAGLPPASPVTLIRPPMACTTMSYAGRFR
ncbi:hypothetical protein D3C87_1176890 [compost metagenome]